MNDAVRSIVIAMLTLLSFLASCEAVSFRVIVLRQDGTPASAESVFAAASDGTYLGGATTDQAGEFSFNTSQNYEFVTFRFPTSNHDLRLSGKFDHITSYYFPSVVRRTVWAHNLDIPELRGIAELLEDIKRNHADKPLPNSVIELLRNGKLSTEIRKYTQPQETDNEDARTRKQEIRADLLNDVQSLSRAWYLGVNYDYIDGGARVTSVAAQSPAEQIGIQPNDVIRSVTTDRVSYVINPHTMSLANALRKDVDGNVKIGLIRGGDTMMRTVKLEERDR